VIEATKAFPQPETHPSLVICTVPDEQSLCAFAGRLDSKGLGYAIFQEPDQGNRYTALATEPVYGKNRKLFKKLPLLKEPSYV